MRTTSLTPAFYVVRRGLRFGSNRGGAALVIVP